MLWGHICQHSGAEKHDAQWWLTKYRKIGRLWVGGGAECSGSSGTEQNRKIGEKERKNSNIITFTRGQILLVGQIMTQTHENLWEQGYASHPLLCQSSELYPQHIIWYIFSLWEEILCHGLRHWAHQAQGVVLTVVDDQWASQCQGIGCTPLHSSGYWLKINIAQNCSLMWPSFVWSVVIQ